MDVTAHRLIWRNSVCSGFEGSYLRKRFFIAIAGLAIVVLIWHPKACAWGSRSVVEAATCAANLQKKPISGLEEAFLETFRNLNSNSIIVVDPWISFSEEEVRATLAFLKAMDRIDGAQSQSGYLFKGDSAVLYQLHEGIPPNVRSKIELLISDIRRLFIRTHGSEPIANSLNLRATSDLFGHSVNRKSLGDRSTGLHSHRYSYPMPKPWPQNQISYVWSLKGPGPRVLQDGIERTIEEGKIVFFGDDVEHGSPESLQDRLIIVGSVSN